MENTAPMSRSNSLLSVDLLARLEAIEKTQTEAIAVIGMGCLFPGGVRDPESFWRILRDGVDAVGETPPGRWNEGVLYDPEPAPGKLYTRGGGFLDDLDRFDAEFFGISTREALSLDPQQRLVLETAWRALEHAGLAPDSLSGSATGVFIGATSSDYARLLLQGGDASRLDGYYTTGNALNAIAGRLSYFLGLQGPSLVVDTACSSSLAAVHLAVQNLRQRECDLALAGGVNVLASPEITVSICQARMLSADGRCKTFDADADGYGRGEGCGIVVLKRLSDALADWDRVLALIRGSAMNQDGRSSGFTVPLGSAQTALIRRALNRAGVAPAAVGYLEAHGTGTPLGDPIEVNAAAAAYGEGRAASSPLYLGSVKTNFGHLEAAAGIAGLIKTVLALQHGIIPPHLHFRQPNPHVAWDALPVRIPTVAVPWPGGTGPRLAGVSAFGISGTNVHTILEEAPPAPPVTATVPERPLQVLTLSTRDTAALRQLAASYQAVLGPDTSLADVAYTVNTGRAHFRQRLAVVAATAGEARIRMETWLGRDEPPKVTADRPRLAFLFTGQGAQYAGMGCHLYAGEPVFRAALEHCDALLRPRLERSLLSVLHPEGEHHGLLGQTAYLQPALFALEYALARLWQSWGVEPDWVMGHSVGEYAAACIAGVFSVEDGLQFVAERARLMQALPRNGAMAAVFLDEAAVARQLSGNAEVAIAAVNGPRNVVLSGPREALEPVLADFRAAGIESRNLEVSHAFHSPALEPILVPLDTAAATLRHHAPRVKLVSNLTGKVAGSEIRQADYWVSHARRPVLFQAGMETLRAEGCRIFLEIGPKPTLIGLGRQCLADGTWLPSLTPEGGWHPLLESLAALYCHGFDIDWAGFHRGRAHRKVALPGYPFQRRRYWPADPLPSSPPDRQDWFYSFRWRKQPEAGANDDHPPPLQSLAAVIGSLARKRVSAPDFLTYWQAVEQLETLAVDYVIRALRNLGWDFSPETPVTPEALADRFGVVEPHRNLFARLLEILVEAGVLEARGRAFQVREPAPPAATAVPLAERLACHPEAALELTLLDRCASRLERVLRGRQDPLQLLFPEGNTATAAGLYQDSPGARVMNELVRNAVAAALAGRPKGRSLRILEIGAGTGGTSAYILPILPAADSEYVYTDVSPFFLAKGREKFRDYRFIRYKTLDIERDPAFQGFAGERFDLCIAANVLHATRDLRQSLDHLRRLLVPDGLLILLEGTAPLRFIDLIFGQTEGWWRFQDRERRPAHPLLGIPGWLAVLRECGYVEAVPLSGTGAGLLGKQSVIAARTPPRPPAHWLVLADRTGFGEHLAARLEAVGDDCTLVHAGPGSALDDDRLHLVPSDPAAIEHLLARIPEPRGILHLWSLDAPSAPALSSETLKTATQLGCRTALHLVQALARTRLRPTLWFVTRNAVAATPEEAVPGLAAAPLWGMGRALRSEHPELRCVQVDLDTAPGNAALAALCRAIRADGDDDQIVLRGGHRYVPRLTRLRYSPQEPAFRARTDASYLITGGLRGLGPLLARWLAERGARHLALLGRREADAAGRSVIEALEEKGVRILTLKADVADHGRMTEAMAEIEASLPPLRGVIHSAGVLDDGVLEQQDWDRFGRVLEPKVQGSWHLHQLTLGRPLDFFVLFSSIAALVGPPAQANHAAACAFQDALAHYRRAEGLPVLSIDWGAWSEVGAAANTRVSERVRGKGMGSIVPEQGLRALEQALAGGETQVVVWPVDWPAWCTQYADRPPRWLQEVLTGVDSGPIESVRTVRRQLEEAVSDTAREAVLKTYLNERLSRILNLPPGQGLPEDRLLRELGLDSLVSTELKNHLRTDLGTDVPMEQLLGELSLASLAGLLVDRLSLARVLFTEPAAPDEDLEEIRL